MPLRLANCHAKSAKPASHDQHLRSWRQCMEERQVLLDTFVAKIKLSAALCRGDRIQAWNYAQTLYRYTAGEYGYFTAAATGETLAMTVLTQVVDYSTGQLAVNALMMDRRFPGYSVKRLEVFLGEVLSSQLPPTLGNIPESNTQMICAEVWVIAMDASRGKNSEAVMLSKSLQREDRSSRLQRALEEHAPWIGRLVTEILKSAGP